MQNPRGLESYERFKFEMLSEATTDSQGIWEPLWYLRGNVREVVQLPELSEEEHRRLAEAVLLDLWRDGLVFFFRAKTEWYDADPADSATHLNPEQVEEVILGRDWRTVPITSDVWFLATPKGEHAWANYAKRSWPQKTKKQRRRSR